MRANQEDHSIKEELLRREFHLIPDMISERVNQTLSNIANENEERVPFIRKNKRRRWMISAFSAACVSLLLLLSAPVIASSYLTNQAYKNKAYIVLEGYYYYATSQQIPQSLIGEQVGEVRRTGNWNFKEDGDTNEFLAGTPIYKINDSSPGEAYAVRVAIGNLDYLSTYIEVKRGEAVQQPDEESIFSAKNDPKEVGITLNNIEKKPNIYTFQDLGSRVMPTKADYVENKGATFYYRVPEADTTTKGDMEVQGTLIIFEYKKGMETEFPQSAFVPGFKFISEDDGQTIRRITDPDFELPTPKESFEANDILWNYYSDQLLRGNNDQMYYEIQTYGNFSYDLLQELLHSFKPSSQ